MYKVAGLVAIPGAVSLVSGTVFAASEGKQDTHLRTDELSLYTTPQQKFTYVEPKEGELEQGVALLRETAEPVTTWCQQTSLTAVEKVQGIYGAVKPKVEMSVQFGKDSYVYLKDPPSGFYPRAGVIGFAGILGLFLARGSRIKRLIYPTGLMALGVSMYYPQQAASVAKTTGDVLYDWSIQGYVAVEKLWKDKPVSKQVKEKPEKEKTAENSSAAGGEANH